MPRTSKVFLLATALLLAVSAFGLTRSVADEETKKPDPALQRARKQVQMLDDLYKHTIVLITDNYVTEESELPAGKAFKAVFQAMKDKGYHEVRLLDATGEPYEPANAPSDEFEKKAIQQLKAGKPYYDQVVESEGKRYLRAATAIPVVMEKCAACHENYKTAKKGEAIGALGYILPIEE